MRLRIAGNSRSSISRVQDQVASLGGSSSATPEHHRSSFYSSPPILLSALWYAELLLTVEVLGC
ncbi:hypothetical protein FOXG_21225 [Fusarium oxysporum f. sp. lycopersici 4287]|uniref:Uncharacterized protein n=2 Tax=Fusarium oxysporum TaxID=5507 RepID=A0A0J9VWC1_FUSO4|nr:hypothetical protein FOXG_21225 [Fusarium oxysporum f. sp. lycopersici 4287]EXK34641.1 hypothetical protein FOMG_10024 [Fusarium oxysporum f. sp. melonis 26406]KNB14885.1 hypothetical protein FOXG_21225 [Fusarium oxysporum f. sp. lycopersici 4287]